jgi:hypothetical protein
LAALPAWADDAVDTFKRSWAEASRQDDSSPGQIEAVRALARGASPACAKVLVKLLVDPGLHYTVRDAAEEALHGLTAPEVALWASKGLEGGEKDTSKRVVLCTFLAARAEQDPGTGMLLLPALEDKQAKVQTAAIRGLGAVRRKVVVTALVRLLAKSEGRVRGDCHRALRRVTGQSLEADAWVGWWAVKEDSFSFEASEAEDEEDGEDGGGRFKTVTRLEPPGKPGATIYEKVDSQRVVFVVDFSGSMRIKCKDTSGRFQSRLAYVKSELITVIMNELGEGARFNIVSFSTDVISWKKKLVKATDSNKKKARTWIRRNLKPDGETNIYGALKTAFAHKDADTIYFLTDGTPTAGEVRINDEILGRVRKWNTSRGLRVHTIGFLAGDSGPLIVENKDMSKRFLKSLAKQNDGSFRAFE